MVDPEYYLGAFKGPDGKWITTKFSDSADVMDYSEDSTKVRSNSVYISQEVLQLLSRRMQ